MNLTPTTFQQHLLSTKGTDIMPLQISTQPDGTNTVIYVPPHPSSISNTIPVPHFSEVEAAFQRLQTSNIGGLEYADAMDTIERFIYTR